MKYMRTLIAGAAVLVPVLLSAVDVNKDWDKAYDFAKVKTFAAKIGQSWGNPLSENRVKADFSEALTEIGWKVAPEASADAVMVLNGATSTRKNVNTFYSGGGYGGWGYGGWGGGSATTTVSDYLVGTLVVDIFDAKTHKLVFRATATDEISKDPSKNEKKIDKAATKIFKDFPPGSKNGK